MEGLEFYCYESELWCKHGDGRNEIVDESQTELISYILDKVRECYPDAYKALEKCYSNSSRNIRYYQYLMARRFIRCNFSTLDATSLDVDDVSVDGRFNFEKVCCPMRGECVFEGVICRPRFNSKLSPAELRVMELLYKGYGKEKISDTLYLSPDTIKTHIKNVYVKLGIHEKAEFIRYANDNHLFDNAQE